MSCPYSDAELCFWDGVCNPMGEECSSCEEFDCCHNDNDDNPERWDFEGSGNPMTPEEFAKYNVGIKEGDIKL